MITDTDTHRQNAKILISDFNVSLHQIENLRLKQYCFYRIITSFQPSVEKLLNDHDFFSSNIYDRIAILDMQHI